MGIALVDEDGHLQPCGQQELCFECLFLRCARGKIAIEVEAGFANGHDCRLAGQCFQLLQTVGVQRVGMVRMHAGGAHDLSRKARGDSGRLATVLDRCSGSHQDMHAGGGGLFQHCLQVPGKRPVAEIDADVDQFHGYSLKGFGEPRMIPGNDDARPEYARPRA